MTKRTVQSNRPSHKRWSQSAVALYLLIALQAFKWDCGKGLGKSITPSFQSTERLRGDLGDSKDISRMRDGTTWLHVAVKNAIETSKLEKLNVVLSRIKQDQAEPKGPKYQNDFPNSVDRTGWTPLGLAIKGGKVEVVKCLTDENLIDVNSVGHKLTSLLLAFKKKQDDIAAYLLGLYGIDITSQDPTTGETALHIMARKKGYKSLMKILVNKLINGNHKHGSKNNEDNKKLLRDLLLAKDNQNFMALHLAALYNNKDAFDLLFKQIESVFEGELEKVVYNVLFKKDAKKERKVPSLFALAYSEAPLSPERFIEVLFAAAKFGKGGRHKANLDMFKYVLETVQGYLKLEDWDKILEEINQLPPEAKTQKSKEGNSSYVDQLRDIVKSVRAGSNKPEENKAGVVEKDLITFD